MAISAQDVNKLRQETGAGMMDCKKALTEAGGDFEAAKDILRKKGQKISASRADRTTTEGVVFIRTNADNTEGVAIALNCETDFVAKNEDFISLGNQVVEAVFALKPASLAEVNAMQLGGRPLSEVLVDYIGKIGEKLEVTQYAHVKSERVVSYLHGNQKVGVLVALKGGSDDEAVAAGKDVAMQIAAMRPLALDKDDVDPATIQREIEIGKEQARAEGKPEAMLEKIALGKLSRFYKDNTLLNQDFVKDNKVTVAQYLDSVQKGLTVSAFSRITVSN
jgi:elongation factor Ts